MNKLGNISATFTTLSVSRKAGGIYFALLPLVKSLIKLDVDVNVVGPQDDFTFEDATSWPNNSTKSYKVLGPKAFGYSREIRNLIGAPDIQHMHGIWMYHSNVNRQVALQNRTPYLVSPHGMLDKWAIENSGWKKKVAGWLYEHRHLHDAACIHALCESEAQSIRDFGLKNPICVIPNAVDLPSIEIVNEAPKHSREKKLLFLGRLHPKKGLAELFKAYSTLDEKRQKEWRLVIAGWDQNYQTELQQQTDLLAIADRVDFVGPKFGLEKEELFRSCDGFVLPSYSEGLPMAVLEAWSYGMPTLITEACNLPEGKSTSATVQCESGVEGIRQGLVDLFSLCHAEQIAMGARARSLVEEKFTWPIVAAEMKHVYNWLLSRGDKPDCVMS